MVYDAAHKHRKLPLGETNQDVGHRTLSEFQRWVIRKAYTFVPFESYDVNAKGHSTERSAYNLLG